MNLKDDERQTLVNLYLSKSDEAMEDCFNGLVCW